jgi:phosphoesterase RecJ-like protein
MLIALDYPINQDSAKALFTGIVTDSGRFMYQAVTSNTLSMGAKLIETGIKPFEEIYNFLYQKEIKDIKFMSFYLKHIKFSKKVAYFIVSKRVIKKFNLDINQSAL